MKRLFYCLPLVIVLTACHTITPIPATPVEPKWVTLTKPPVIKANGDHTFIVTQELVERAAQQDDFIKRFDHWKVLHKIP